MHEQSSLGGGEVSDLRRHLAHRAPPVLAAFLITLGVIRLITASFRAI